MDFEQVTKSRQAQEAKAQIDQLVVLVKSLTTDVAALTAKLDALIKKKD